MPAGLVLGLLLGFAAKGQETQETVSLLDRDSERYGWSYGDGPEFPGAKGALAVDPDVREEGGQAALRLESDFTAGGGYVQAGRNFRDAPDVRELHIRLKDPDSDGLTLRLIDGGGQVHQFKLAKPRSPDWQTVVVPVAQLFAARAADRPLPAGMQHEFWAGPKDGRWRGPLRSVFLMASKREAEKRTLWISDIRVLPRPPPPVKTVRLDELDDGTAPWSLSLGQEFAGAEGSLEVFEPGDGFTGKGLRLSGDFRNGGAYVAAVCELRPLPLEDLEAVRLRYRTRDAHSTTLRLMDASGQTFQRRAVKLVADGEWHELEITPAQTVGGGQRWGGANDGAWHAPADQVSLAIGTYSNPDRKQISLEIADARAEGPEGPPRDPLPPVDDTQEHPVTILTADPAEIRVQPETGFTYTLRWEAEPTEADFRVFVHIVDAEGRTVLQDDHTPPTPTTKWSGRIAYERTVHLPRWQPQGAVSIPGPKAGRYTIFAGLADARSRKLLRSGADVETDAAERRYRVATLVLDPAAPLPVLPEPTLDLTGYTLTFSDEFDDLSVSAWGPNGPDGTRWIAHTPYRGDFGDARFADPAEGFPFTVEDGILRIEARKEANGRWRSGLLASIDPQGRGFSQTYGYFECRAKFPRGPGTWPAFWLHGTDRVVHADETSREIIEIDIIEQYGHWPSKHTSAIHRWLRDGRPSTHLGQSRVIPGMDEDFHTYGAMVTEEWIIFYFDGVEIRREPTPESGKRPLYVMVNLALGPGWPLDQTPSPSYMYVDYVRVYAKE